MTSLESHARRAERLLEHLAAQEETFRNLDPDEHLSMVVDGRVKALNASRDWTLEVARVEALLAIADAVSAIAYHLSER